MSGTNVEVVCDQFAATNERDFRRAMSHYAEEVELVVHRDAFLAGGTFNGRHAVGQWFADWFTTFEPGYHFDIEETLDFALSSIPAAPKHSKPPGCRNSEACEQNSATSRDTAGREVAWIAAMSIPRPLHG